MFQVERIHNGFLLVCGNQQEFHKTEKQLINGIRELLLLKKVGRPKKVEKDEVPF